MEKPTTVTGLFRDDNGALINKNNDALLSYKAKKEQSRKLKDLEEKYKVLSNDITSIKEMLGQILEQTKVK